MIKNIQNNLFPLSLVTVNEDEFNDENYTKEYVVKPFRDLVNGFDLDPFSCDRANQIIQSSTFWTKADDAFSKDWSLYHTKWINPPYSKGLIEKAVAMTISYSHIGHSFLLTNSNTSSDWYLEAQKNSKCYLTFNHRLEFTNPKNDGKKKKSGNDASQTLFYFGNLIPQEFKKTCQHLGNISVII